MSLFFSFIGVYFIYKFTGGNGRAEGGELDREKLVGGGEERRRGDHGRLEL